MTNVTNMIDWSLTLGAKALTRLNSSEKKKKKQWRLPCLVSACSFCPIRFRPWPPSRDSVFFYPSSCVLRRKNYISILLFRIKKQKKNASSNASQRKRNFLTNLSHAQAENIKLIARETLFGFYFGFFYERVEKKALVVEKRKLINTFHNAKTATICQLVFYFCLHYDVKRKRERKEIHLSVVTRWERGRHHEFINDPLRNTHCGFANVDSLF